MAKPPRFKNSQPSDQLSMAFKALFVGINEYKDLTLDNLEGARPDAVALHALFTDSEPTLEAHVLTDAAATKSAVDAALSEVLLNADADDTVLVSFSGHGSDEGLYLHDSDCAKPETLIAMSEVADRFQRTKAARVIVLLDCCQAGEGPRSVLNSWANLDGIDPALLSSDGGGRMMIAAANPIQSANESAVVEGHGLLTAALMDVLLNADDPVDIRVIASTVSESVRAEAARIGEDQNPVDVSVMAGGFTLPPLRVGNAYHAAFPERTSAVIAGAFDELQAYGILSSITEIWQRDYPTGLNQLQMSAVNEHRLLDGQNLLVVAPTGSGKTLLGEMSALQAVSYGRRAVFLVPLKALAAEKHAEFKARYADTLGLRIIVCSGDSTDTVPEFMRGKYDLAILTYEMFLKLVLSSSTALLHVGTLVVDEAHTINDATRGITVELLLTLVVAARTNGRAAPQLVALSAVIGKINHFDKWLNAGLLAHTKRPVPLIEGVIDRNGLFQHLDVNGKEAISQLLPQHEIYMRKGKPEAQDVVVPLARHILKDSSETILIFRATKGKASGAAGYLGRELGLARAANALQALPAVAASTDTHRLRECLEGGTAFHTADLVKQERTVVEQAFRDGELRVVAATTTLAAGINTPATTVLIVDHKFYDKDYSTAEYKNMAGRAGRPGYAPVGRSMLYAETSVEREHLFRTYVKGEPEGVRSSFAAGDLDTWLIRLLRQAGAVPADAVIGLLANTFGGYSEIRRDASWRGRMELELGHLLQRMRDLKLVEEYRARLSLTQLGQACGEASLSLDSCMDYVEKLRRQGLPSPTEMMILIQALGESDRVFTPLARANRNQTDRGWPQRLASRTRRNIVEELRGGELVDGLERRSKRSLVLLDWIAGMGMTEIERRYSVPFSAVPAGTVRSFADTTRFHLQSAGDIARAVFDTRPFPDDEFKSLLETLERGLPIELLELTRKVPTLMREEILALSRNGVSTPEAARQASDETLLKALGDKHRVATLRSGSAQVSPSVVGAASSAPSVASP